MKATKLLTTFLSVLCLYAVQVTMIPTAYAETPTSDTATSTPEFQTEGLPGLPSITEDGTSNVDTGSTTVQPVAAKDTDKDGIKTIKQEGGNIYKGDKSDSAKKEKTEGFMAQILMFGVITMASLAIYFCLGNHDVKVFAASVGIYIASEISNWNQYKKEVGQQMEAQEGSKELNQVQKESFFNAADKSEAAAAAADRRAQSARIAAMGFAVAAITASIFAFLNRPCTVDCSPTSDRLFYMCKSLGSNSIQDYYLSPDATHRAIAGLDFGALEDYYQGADNDLDTTVRINEIDRYKKGALASTTVKHYDDAESLWGHLKAENKFVSFFKKIGYTVADTIFPAAQAEGKGASGLLMSLGIGVGAAVLIFKAAAGSTKAWVAKSKNGITRAVIFGVFSALALTVAGAAKGAANGYRNDAKRYRALANKLRDQTLSTSNHMAIDNTYEVGNAGATNINGGGSTEVQTCFTGNASQLNEDSQCACKDKNICKKTRLPKIKMGSTKLPSALTSSMDMLGSSGDDIFSGNLEGGLANANAAGKNAARLRKAQIGIRKQFNDQISAAGGKPIDFDKIEAGMRSGLIKAVTADLANLSGDAKTALGGRFPGVFGGEGATKDPNEGIKMGDTKVKTGGGKAIAKGSKGSKKKDPMAGFSFEMDEEEDAKANADGMVAQLDAANANDQVEMNADDIDSDRNKNIFSLITKRYFKTAYPRFFDSADE